MEGEFSDPEASEAALEAAIGVESADHVVIKWVQPNDTKATTGHQAGYHLPKASWPMFHDRPGEKGENLKRPIKVHWYGFGTTDSNWNWYGKETRSEYRLTTFGRKPPFPFREPENVGSLLVIHSTDEPGEYRAYSLDDDEEIEDFLELTGLTPGDIGRYASTAPVEEDCVDGEIAKVLDAHADWPGTKEMSAFARSIAELCLGASTSDPDASIKSFTDVEYRLFRRFERRTFEEVVAEQEIDTIERLIEQGNSFNNRRKSRAGKSLEHHVEACLDEARLPFGSQVKTEKKRTMDFMLPGQAAYDDPHYPDDELIALATKTSTKERWAQVLNEAGRCRQKFLLTTQPVTEDTLDDMAAAGLTLVVPKEYLGEFPKSVRKKVLTVEQFLEHARTTLGAPQA